MTTEADVHVAVIRLFCRVRGDVAAHVAANRAALSALPADQKRTVWAAMRTACERLGEPLPKRAS